MPQFTFTGSETLVFPTLAAADGSTLVCNPGDVVTLDADPQLPGLLTAATAKAPAQAPAPEAPQTAPEAPTTPAATA